MKPTIIDKSETIKTLAVDAGATVRITHNKKTPEGEHHVRVAVKDISLGLGASVLVQHHAELVLSGVSALDVLGTLKIGNGGKLFLNSTVGANALSNIDFTNTTGHAVLLINTSHVSLTGNINGFGAHDEIRLGHLDAASAQWSPGLLGAGTLELFNSSGTEVGAIGLTGTYTTADFRITAGKNAKGNYTTNINFVGSQAEMAPGAHGFTVPEPASAGMSAHPVAEYGGRTGAFASAEHLNFAALVSAITHHA